ncbi:protein kinase, putative [Phytophthora infestans T30-4]|uniref:Protein kinase, putative n=1 Tax=Phytophthora infestans (strain T30-4) TaxID=403677 RepID=D0NPX0_PHYIT|nr:protein kinase, putative [Phytophthora infestans T30-4]EEY62682.1 protein kinase, putative [Phytophthora infestans T30-4]|eukprot:XP_002898924.1 protein kinase, putative [Phytophthora infestans T30-4]
MEDSVTISASVAVRSVRDTEQGVYEYLEEQHPLPSYPERTLALPVRLRGWLWRREGFGIFRRYRRRFCVFKAQQATLFVFSDDDTVNGKQLRRLVLTKATLTSRADRSFVVQGYLQDRDLHMEASDSLASSLSRSRFPGDKQRLYSTGEERFKAVSAKACSVWTHCFKYHMKSYALRKPDVDQEEEHAAVIDPDFVFEDATKSGKRRNTLPIPSNSFKSFSSSSGLLSTSRSRSRSKGRLVVQRRESLGGHGSDAPKSAPPHLQVVTELSQNQDEDVEEETSILASDLPCITRIWEDEELLSHRIDYDTIVKKEKLAAGANGEVWRAMHRSQEVVVKNLLGEVMAGSKTPTSSSGNEVSAVYHRRRAILEFVEEIRIMSRLEHNRIVEFRGVALSAERDLLLVLEYLPRGDLRTFLNTVKRSGDNSTSASGGSSGRYLSIWTWTKSQWRLAIDIIEGLVYLHSLNPPLVHGDVKSANVLLRSNLRAKLTDFGLSRYLPCEDDSLRSADAATEGGEKNPTTGTTDKSSRCGPRVRGTGRWMAPELLASGDQSSVASDVYAFGVVLSEIDTCDLPFTEREKLTARSHTNAGEGSSEDSDSRLMNENIIVHKIAAEGWKPTFRVTCPEVIKKLAQDCLLPDPSARPTSLAVAHRLRQAATKRERPEALAAQAKATTSLRIR